MALPPFTDASAKKTPTVYFIDDSATMREVIKIAFRRENFNVITCGDAASALSQFEQNPPDAVITDVIMPDQDGYSVCTQIKQHEKFGHIPVVLMSGVVNKTVADKAVGVKADELIRKPFQPQELIGRVKALLYPKSASTSAAPAERPALPSLLQPAPQSHAPTSLSSLFAPPQPISVAPQQLAAQPTSPNAGGQQTPENAWPRALADAFTPPPTFANPPAQRFQPPQPTHPGYPQQPAQPAHGGFGNPNQQATHFRERATGTGTVSPLRRRSHKAPRRNRASRSPSQETSDRASNRTPIQPSARSTAPGPHTIRVVICAGELFRPAPSQSRWPFFSSRVASFLQALLHIPDISPHRVHEVRFAVQAAYFPLPRLRTSTQTRAQLHPSESQSSPNSPLPHRERTTRSTVGPATESIRARP